MRLTINAVLDLLPLPMLKPIGGDMLEPSIVVQKECTELFQELEDDPTSEKSTSFSQSMMRKLANVDLRYL